MPTDLGLKALVLSPLIIIAGVMCVFSFYLGYQQAQKTSISRTVIKGAVGILVLVGLNYFSPDKTFGKYNTLYIGIIFALTAGGYFPGVLIGYLKKKN